MSKNKIIIALIISLIGFSSFVAYRYGPQYFPRPTYIGELRPNRQKVELGRQLFYDPILSKDSSISCASCHAPFSAFAHTDHDLSHGIHDSVGTRNAPALFNLAWQKSFMWDGAINHLDVQALAPIAHPGEMNEDIKNIAGKLKKVPFYQKAFSAIYGDKEITGVRILKNLSAFQLRLLSINSKYDSVQRHESTFSNQELKGYELFKTNCNSCHTEPLFSSYEFANNGLAVDTTLNDFGRYKVTKNPSDSLLFKIPSLRNLTYTFPYMHDGRFDKIRQVLNHYDKQVINSPTIAKELKHGIQLSSNEKTDLIAFLLTLNDRAFVTNKSLNFPQKKSNSQRNYNKKPSK